VIAILLRTIYATGLRLSEALHLTAEHIDSRRLLLRVLGKGQKERVIPLSPLLLPELRAYWLKVRPGRWLFPGKRKERRLCPSSVQRACQKICREQGLPRISPHTLRHCYVRDPGGGAGRSDDLRIMTGPRRQLRGGSASTTRTAKEADFVRGLVHSGV
jgi:integrase